MHGPKISTALERIAQIYLSYLPLFASLIYIYKVGQGQSLYYTGRKEGVITVVGLGVRKALVGNLTQLTIHPVALKLVQLFNVAALFI